MTPQPRLISFGALGLESDGRAALPGRRKPLTLLVYLARRSGTRVRRAELAALFWPSSDESKARQSLRQTLAELRDVLPRELSITDHDVQLEPGLLWLDANALELAEKEGRHAEALALWAGDFLPDADAIGGEDFRIWLEAEREGLRGRLAAANEGELQRLSASGSWPEAMGVAKQWTVRAPYSERAARRLVEILILAGRRAVAAQEHAAALERLRLLGIAPTPAFAALGVATQKASTDAPLSVLALLSPDLIGRSDALAALTSSWHRVVLGGSAVLLLDGDPGSGKSRLLEEFVRVVSREPGPAAVLHTRAFAAESEAPRALMRHLLAPLARAPGVASAPAGVLLSLRAWIPEFAEAFPVLASEATVDATEAIARVIAAVAEETPVLMAVDDAHLADAESQAILEALSRRPPLRMLLVVSGDAEARGGMSGTRLVLPNLDGAGIEQLVASMAEFHPVDRRILVARLVEETGGNPLAAVEIVRGLAEMGAIAPGPDGSWRTTLRDRAPLPVPASLRESALARTAGLSNDARTILEGSVVAGRELDVETVRELTRLDGDRLERGLEDLIARRLLRPATDGSARLEFAHEHLRRAVYETLSPIRRADWHDQLHEVLRKRADKERVPAAVLDYHRARAGRRTGAWYRSRGAGIAAGTVLALSVAIVGYRSSAERTREPTGTFAWFETNSVEARREYLEGERLFGQFDIAEAIQAYRRATRHDTALAVAWYRIGDGSLWLLRSDVARVAADSAVRYASRLDPHESVHYRAFRDFANGRISEAEAKLRGEVAVYPRRTESRYLLADLLYHYYWLKGTSSREARLLFEGLRRDQPGDWRPLVHLWDIAMTEGRRDAAAAIRDTIHALAPDADLYDGFDAITLFGGGDSAVRVQVLDSLRNRDQWTLANIIRRYATLTADIEGTQLLSALLTLPDRPPEVRATGHLFRSIGSLAQGRLVEATQEAKRAAEAAPISEFQWAALLLSPGLSGGAMLTRERERLRGSLSMGDGVALAVMPLPYYPWTDFDRLHADEILSELRGRLAVDEVDSAAAARVLSNLARQPVDQVTMSVFAAQPGGRYAVAQSLAAQGQKAEAIGWLAPIGEGSIFDMALIAPAAYRRAELLEQGGDVDGARAAYQRVVRLYAHADPEFRILLARAEEGLRRLGK